MAVLEDRHHHPGSESRPTKGSGSCVSSEGFGEAGGSRRWVLADDGITTTYHAILVVEHMSEWLFPGWGRVVASM